MKKMMLPLALVPLLFLTSCTKDPSGPDDGGTAPSAARGVYILHEGNFGDAAGARLALYDLVRDSVSLDVVEGANSGQHLGSTGDDMFLFRDRLYILMSGSENLVVVSTADHRILQTAYFPGRVPHAMVLDSVRGRLYITELYRNSVIAVDLVSLAVVDSAAVGANPQELLLAGTDLYVCNSGYGADRTVSVLTLAPFAVAKTLTVGSGPTGITRTPDGALMVACTGNAFAVPPVPGGLYRIDPAARAVTDSVVLTTPLWGTLTAGTNGDVLFLGTTTGSYYGGPVHRYHLASRTVTQSVIAGTFYALAVDGVSGDVYVADAKGFVSAGEVAVYSSAFNAKKSLTVQRGPAVIAFKR